MIKYCIKNKISFIVSFLLSLLFLSCSMGSNQEKGSIEVKIDDSIERTINSEVSLDVVSYTVSCDGSQGQTIEKSFLVNDSIVLEELDFGEWTVAVSAFNEQNILIGYGHNVVSVHSNLLSSVSISINPLDGVGTFSFSVKWQSEQIEFPELLATLTPVNGDNLILDFSLGLENGFVEYVGELDSGYYTLVLQLFDNGVLTTGLVEIVHIVTDQNSSADIIFENLNKPGGSIDMNISYDFYDPLEIDVIGLQTFIKSSESVSYSANVNNYLNNVIYSWYVDGIAVNTGESFIFDSRWGSGYHRISVTAFSADGNRAGSLENISYVIDDDSTKHNDRSYADRLVIGASSYYIDIENNLWTWGENRDGELLRSVVSSGKYLPEIVMTDVEKVFSDGYSVGIIKTDKSYWTCGYNYNYQLGDGSRTSRSEPIQTMTDVVSATVTYSSHFMITSSGDLYVSGWNKNGHYGVDGDTFNPTPGYVMSDVKKVVSNGYSTFILKTDDSVWAVGRNSNGIIGGEVLNIDYTIPFQLDTNVKDIVLNNNSFILKDDGSLFATGYNIYGELLTGNTTPLEEFSLVQVDVQKINAGTNFTLFTKFDGNTWGAGRNYNGELGLGHGNETIVPEIIGYGLEEILTTENTNVVETKNGELLIFGITNHGPLWENKQFEYTPSIFFAPQ